MAAIPDTGGAQCAPRGVMSALVMRALVRVTVLGGLVITGWLLASGTGHADEGLGQPDTGLIRLVSTSSGRAAPSDEGSGGRLGVPPMVGSTIKTVLSAAPVSPQVVQPPAKVGILTPIVNADSMVKPLTSVLAPVSHPLSGTVQHGSATRSQALAGTPVTAAPAVAVAAVTTPVPAPVLTKVSHAPPAIPVCAADHPTADPVVGMSALGSDPATPLPASPPGSTTSPCLIGSTGGGAGTRSAPDLAVNDSWATAGLAPTYRLRYLGASDLPRSRATRPATSPD